MAARSPRSFVDPNAPNDPAVEAAFQAVPDTVIGEILEGELHTQEHRSRAHVRTASMLAGELFQPFGRGRDPQRSWVLLNKPEVHLGPKPDKVVPDRAGWRRERMPDAIGPADAPAHYDLAPDWVCELLSPATEAVDRSKKMRIYRREGVGHVWLVNPVLKFLQVFRIEAGQWIFVDTFEDDAVVRAEPFDAIELELSALWER